MDTVTDKPTGNQELIREEDQDGWRWYVTGLGTAQKRYISVTKVLDHIVHERLKKAFINTSKATMEKRRDLTAEQGNKIHHYIQEDLQGRKPVIEPDLQGVFDNWLKLKEENPLLHSMQEVQVEKYVFSPLGFAGAVDIVALINGHRWIFDIKTGFYSVTAGWQMAAYKLALDQAGLPVEGMGGISVNRDANKKPQFFKYEHMDFCLQRFLSAYETFKGLYYTKLDKIGFEHLHDFTPARYEWREQS